MAAVPAPGVVQIKASGTTGPDVWTIIQHGFWFGQTGLVSIPNLNAVATTFLNQWVLHFMPLTTSNNVLQTVTAVDLTGPTGAETTQTTVTPGTRTGTVLPSSTCVVLSKAINYKRRGGHPRSYMLPGAEADLQDSAHWGASFLGNFGTAYNAFWAAMASGVPTVGSSSFQECVPLYTYTYTASSTAHKFLAERTGYIGAFPVIGTPTARAQLGTQRRRVRASG